MGDFSLYYSSPIEVPAYKHAVREAERLGMTRAEIVEYLKMLPVTSKIWDGFIKEMRIKARATTRTEAERSSERLPVKINRDPKLTLLPFIDYFQGFEEAPPVNALFGRGAKEALNAVKVEFLESPFGSIFPSEEDGHMVVNRSFIEGADLESIYLDVILCLNFPQARRRVEHCVARPYGARREPARARILQGDGQRGEEDRHPRRQDLGATPAPAVHDERRGVSASSPGLFGLKPGK